MDAVDSIMLGDSLPEIIEQLKISFKFKALLIKKRILHGDVVDQILQGEDKDELGYNFVKALREQPSPDVGGFIEALDEAGQDKLARTLKTNRETAKETLRRGLKDALGRGSDNKEEEGRVAVDGDLFLDKCRAFSNRESNEVPGPLQWTEATENTRCISRDCADKIIRLLGVKVEVLVERRHDGWCLVRRSDGEVMRFYYTVVTKCPERDVVNNSWGKPNFKPIDQSTTHFVPGYKKVTDCLGQVVDLSGKMKDWWPTAPVGASGNREFHIWRAQPLRRSDIKHLKQ